MERIKAVGSSQDHEDHGAGYYVRIWGLLLVLLVISIIGPELGIQWVTLVTAFGIAIVKAWIVAAYFMHLNIEKRFINYLFGAMLLFMVVMFAGVAPDVMRTSGTRWENRSALDVIEANKDYHKKLHGDAKADH